MVKSKNRVFFTGGVILCLMALLMTMCHVDWDEDIDYSQKYDRKVAEAKRWYESNYPDNFSIKNNEGVSLAEMKPNWDDAFTRSDKWEATVEVEIEKGNSIGFAVTENKSKFEETGDERYLASTTRLVIRTKRRTKEVDGFLMTIIPSPEYMEHISFGTPKEVAYIGRDKRFSGQIIYHSLDGIFANGWEYKDGNIIKSIGDGSAERGSIKRLSQVCEWEVICVYKRFCWMAGSFFNCTEWEIDYCYLDLLFCYESDPGGEIEQGGGDGGGGYNPNSPYISLSVNPPGSGTVAGGGTYTSGTVVSISANPKPGYVFDNWSGSVNTSTNPYSFTLTSNKFFTANFIHVQSLLCGMYHGVINVAALNKSKSTFMPYHEQFIINLANLAALYELGGSLDYLKQDLDNYSINSSAYSKFSKLYNTGRYTTGWQPAYNSETGTYDALVSSEIGNSGFQLKLYSEKAGENNALGLVKSGFFEHNIEAALEYLERTVIEKFGLLDDFLYDMHFFNALNFMDYYCND